MDMDVDSEAASDATGLAVDDALDLPYVAAPHRGVVFLDTCAHEGVTYLVHTQTHERRQLPASIGTWGLSFFDTEDGYVFDDGSEQECLVEDVLMHHVVVDPADGLPRIAFFSGSEWDGDIVSVAELEKEFSYVDVSLLIGGARCKVTCKAAVFQWARGGARTFWNVYAVTQACSFSHASTSTWVWDSWRTWEHQAHLMGASPQLLRSQAWKAAVPFNASRPLEWPSLGSCLLVRLLMRWCFFARAVGGLGKLTDRNAALSFLEGIVSAVGPGTWEMQLFLDGLEGPDDGGVEWPCRRNGRDPVTLTVIDGCVDLRPIQAFPIHSVRMNIDALEVEQSLADFVARCANTRWAKGTNFVHQMSWIIGARLDSLICGGIGVGVAEFVERPLSVEKLADLELDGSKDARDRALVRYWRSGQLCGEGQLDLSSTNDKARVFGKSYFNGLCCDPANHAWWGPSQVP
jgi:hypothetical protein